MRHELVKYWMAKDVVTITPDTTLPDAEQLMITHMIRRLPVMESGRLIGIVTYGDIRSVRPSRAASLKMWESNFMAARLKVSEFMTADPITIPEDETIGLAAQLMLKYMISGLPVVNEQNRLVGVITESDIFRMVATEWVKESRETNPVNMG